MNKIIASFAALVLVAANVIGPVNAAGVAVTVASSDRITFTVGLPAGVDLEMADSATITISTASNGTAVDLTAGSLVPASAYFVGDANTADTLNNAANASGRFTVTEDGVENPAAGADLVFTLGAALSNNTAYVITYSDTDSNFSAALINFGTANQVPVSATVVPILTMSLANGTDGNQTIAFGQLVPGTFSEDDINVTYATNGVGGVNVTAASTGLATDVDADGTRDNANDREIGVQSIAATANTAAADYYKVSTAAGGTAAVAFDAVDNVITSVAGRDMRATQDVVSATGPVSATQAVTVGTRVANDTEAGDYTDTLTFTLTPTF
ncbi:MAG: hypothetical protein HYT31_00045 [Parcubacteria group bacterium]|nr:hypothetical protein [Parcubacteria group bacterium]